MELDANTMKNEQVESFFLAGTLDLFRKKHEMVYFNQMCHEVIIMHDHNKYIDLQIMSDIFHSKNCGNKMTVV